MDKCRDKIYFYVQFTSPRSHKVADSERSEKGMHTQIARQAIPILPSLAHSWSLNAHSTRAGQGRYSVRITSILPHDDGKHGTIKTSTLARARDRCMKRNCYFSFSSYYYLDVHLPKRNQKQFSIRKKYIVNSISVNNILRVFLCFW